MLEIGRLCYKISGREAGNIVVIVDHLDNNHVLIDGNVKRRKCNISHLEPTERILKIKKRDSTENIHRAMSVAKIKVIKKKPKEEKKESLDKISKNKKPKKKNERKRKRASTKVR